MSSTPDLNVRSLLRKELSSRRITHPYASYTNNKSNLLTCTVCHLIIKTEALWEGHLRSPNHRKNVQKLQDRQEQQRQENGTGDDEHQSAGKKRKADEVDADRADAGRDDDHGGAEFRSINGGGSRKRKATDQAGDESGGDGRKRTKNQESSSQSVMDGFVPASTSADHSVEQPTVEQSRVDVQGATTRNGTPLPLTSEAEPLPTDPPAPIPTINEDEWAAFEADIAPLTQNPQPSNLNPNINTITAAPISASELAAQKEATNKKLSREEEAEAEREDEGRRLAEEFEVQEEMEERVRKLRERREMLRLQVRDDQKEDQGLVPIDAVGQGKEVDGGRLQNNQEEGDDEDDEEDDPDEWGFR